MGLVLAHSSDDWWDSETNIFAAPDAAAVAALPTLEFLYGGYWVQALP
jgi:hypothetical protein